MATVKIALPKSRDVHIPARSAELLMDSGDGNATLLYIYILSHSGEFDEAAATKQLKLPSAELSRAMNVLEGLGLIGHTDTVKIPERSDDVPEYSPTDVAEHLGSDREFKALVEFCENTLGKLLSTVDLQVLLGIYSWLGLPTDVICMLVHTCIASTRRQHGAGRIPTMRMIEKQAKAWVRDGVMTVGRAEEYIKEQEKLGEDKARLASLLRISGRALSPTEEKYISEWLRLSLSDELIEAAYDKTVINTGKLKWSYMHKILSSWGALGFKTLADVESGDIKPGGGNTEIQVDENAARRLRELNRKKKEAAGV